MKVKFMFGTFNFKIQSVINKILDVINLHS